MNPKFAALALAIDAPARMTIVDPVSGQPLRDADGAEAWVDLLSADSAAGRAHDRAVIDQQIKSGGRRATSEQIDANWTERLAKLTVDWRLIGFDGAPLDVPFSANAARELYTLPELSWLRAQVTQFVADLGNFRPAASTS